MPTKLEIERRFLVEMPKSWSDLAQMIDNVVDVKRITQQYLVPEKGEPAVRIRKTIEGLGGETKTVYHANQKELLDTGVNREKEREISEEEYEKLLKKSDPKKHPIEKTRFVFNWNDQEFELDLFKGHLKGRAILELELKDKNQKIEIPPFLKILKEVTDDKNYSNFHLSNR